MNTPLHHLYAHQSSEAKLDSNSVAMSIQYLPDSLLHQIALQADFDKDISRLSRTCRPLFSILIPELYRSDKGNAAILHAIEKDRPESIERILGHTAAVARLHHLSHAIECGSARVVGQIAAIACVQTEWMESSYDRSITPMVSAAKRGDVDIVRLLHIIGVPGELSRSDIARGMSPLTAAALEGHYEVVQYLLENDVPVNSKSRSGMTALHNAVVNSNLKMTQLLVDHGADVGIRNTIGMLPLNEAAGGCNETLVRCLLHAGADANGIVNRANIEYGGQAPLHAVAHPNIAKALLEYGADINKEDFDGETPLESAARAGSLDLVRFFLEQSQDGDSPSTSKISLQQMQNLDKLVYRFAGAVYPRTVLNKTDARELIKLLIQHGMDIGCRQGEPGGKLLRWACAAGSQDTVEDLCDEDRQAGIDKDATGPGRRCQC